MINPETWRPDDDAGWSWLKQRHPSVAALLGEERWGFDGQGVAQPRSPGADAVPGPFDVHELTAESEAWWPVDRDRGTSLAAAVVSPDHDLWIFADPDGPGVAVNGEPVVARALQPTDLVKVGGYFLFVDQRRQGHWLLEGLRGLTGISIEVRGAMGPISNELTLGPVDMTIPAGQLIGITGPSGVGKTQLLHLLARIEVPEAGDVRWCSPTQPSVSPLAFASQQNTIYTDLPALDALEFTARLRGCDVDAARRSARRAMRQLKLDDLLTGEASQTPVAKLSGGQRRRVCVAGELLVDHPLVVLDEPAGGVDLETAERLVRQLKAHTGRGQTVILVDHELQLYEQCDRVIVLGQCRAGGHKYVQVVADSSPEELRTQRKCRTVGAAIREIQADPPPEMSSARLPDAAAGTRSQSVNQHENDHPPQAAAFADLSSRSWVSVLLVNERLSRRARQSSAVDWSFFIGVPVAIVGVIYAADLQQPMMQYLAALTTLWLAMSGAVLTFVGHRNVWQREKHLGLRPIAQVAGSFLHHGMLGMGQALIIALTAFVVSGALSALQANDYHLVEPALWGRWLAAGVALCVIALVGAAFGLAISAWCRRPEQAQSWLAYVLLAHILLTVQVADDENTHTMFGEAIVPGAVNRLASLTASAWGHDLLKIAAVADGKSPSVQLDQYLVALGALVGLASASLVLAWLGLRYSQDIIDRRGPWRQPFIPRLRSNGEGSTT